MKCSIDKLDTLMDAPGLKLQSKESGGMTISNMHCGPGIDFAPMLEGLKDDMCQCPHWGYVLKGEIVVDYSDGEREKISSGESYYLPPGHSVKFAEQTQYVEFSPTKELNEVLAHVASKSA
jgi:hypothetical protein